MAFLREHAGARPRFDDSIGRAIEIAWMVRRATAGGAAEIARPRRLLASIARTCGFGCILSITACGGSTAQSISSGRPDDSSDSGNTDTLEADAGPKDAGGADGDEGTGSAEVFSQWRDPSCMTATDPCGNPYCVPVQLLVVVNACKGTTEMAADGCTYGPKASTGWTCFVRVSDGKIIQSLVLPVSGQGLMSCYAAGLTAGPGASWPECRD